MKKRLILTLGILAVVIIGSTLLYNKLIAGVEPPDMLAGQAGSGTGQSAGGGSTDAGSSEAENATTGPENTGGNAGTSDTQADERVKAPDFTVQDADGNPVKLSDMIGKPVVINFWASWCPPCKSEMPEFNKVFDELGDGIHFMMIDAVDGRRETRETGEAYIAEEGYTFPVYFDMEQEAVIQYGLRAFPTSLFIDSEGYIVAGIEGAIDEATLRRGIEMAR